MVHLQNSLNNANGIISDQDTIDRVAMTVAAMDCDRKSCFWYPWPQESGVDFGRGSHSTGHGERGKAGVADRLGGEFRARGNRLHRPDREGPHKFDDMVKEVADSLNRSNIAMYAIDAKGVEFDTTMDVSHEDGVDGPSAGTPVLNLEQDARDASKLLADRTGGLAFLGTTTFAVPSGALSMMGATPTTSPSIPSIDNGTASSGRSRFVPGRRVYGCVIARATLHSAASDNRKKRSPRAAASGGQPARRHESWE